jgi:hypothetical protein
MKSILMDIVNRLSDMGTSLDAMEAALAESGVLKTDAIGNRFQTHKGIVESHLAGLRAGIALLPD